MTTDFISTSSQPLPQPAPNIPPPKPPKEKNGKGLLIGMLLFLVLTLPLAVYYGTQQITEIRSRAAGATATNTPVPTNTQGLPATQTIANTYNACTCDTPCDTDINCELGLSCYSVTGVKRCRKDACPDRSNCECPIAESPATPTTRYYQPVQPTERVITETPIATATQRPTPKVPVSGSIDVKAIIITVGSALLLALALIL
jgi:hypothetical protein